MCRLKVVTREEVMKRKLETIVEALGIGSRDYYWLVLGFGALGLCNTLLGIL